MAGSKQNKSNKLQLTITTPRGVKFEETADMIVMRAIDGEIGFLPGHTPLITALGDGIMKIQNNGREKQLAIFGGVADVKDDEIQIYSTIAQTPGEIDIERAKEDRERALAALEEELEDQATSRLRAMAYKALVRIRVSNSDFLGDSSDEMLGLNEDDELFK